MVKHKSKPSTKAMEEEDEFEVGLGYIASSRLPCGTQRNPASKTLKEGDRDGSVGKDACCQT